MPVDVEEQARRALASSGGLPIAVAYPMLTLCTGLAGDLWENHLTLLAAVIAGLVILGGFRELVGKGLRQAPSPQISAWRFRYSLSVLAQAAVWSTFSAGTVYHYGKSWTGLSWWRSLRLALSALRAPRRARVRLNCTTLLRSSLVT